jgi:hypothetical protein
MHQQPRILDERRNLFLDPGAEFEPLRELSGARHAIVAITEHVDQERREPDRVLIAARRPGVCTRGGPDEFLETLERVPSVETRTPVASVAGTEPSTLRAKSSRARVRSSGPTTVVKCRPFTLPSTRSAAGLIHRMTPSASRM